MPAMDAVEVADREVTASGPGGDVGEVFERDHRRPSPSACRDRRPDPRPKSPGSAHPSTTPRIIAPRPTLGQSRASPALHSGFDVAPAICYETGRPAFDGSPEGGPGACPLGPSSSGTSGFGGRPDLKVRLLRDLPGPGPRRPRPPRARGGADHPGGGAHPEGDDALDPRAGVVLRRGPRRRLRRLLPRLLLRREGPEPAPDPQVPHQGPRGPDQGVFPPPWGQDPDPRPVRRRVPDRRVLSRPGILRLPTLKLLLADLFAASISTLLLFWPGLRLRQPRSRKGFQEAKHYVTPVDRPGPGRGMAAAPLREGQAPAPASGSARRSSSRPTTCRCPPTTVHPRSGEMAKPSRIPEARSAGPRRLPRPDPPRAPDRSSTPSLAHHSPLESGRQP